MDDAGGEFASEVWQKKTCGRLSTLCRGAPKIVSCNAAVRRYDSGGGSSGHSLNLPTATWTRLRPCKTFFNFSTWRFTWEVGQPSYTKSMFGGLHPISSTIECMPRKEIHRNTSIQDSTDVNRAGQHLVSSGWLPELGLSVTCQHR